MEKFLGNLGKSAADKSKNKARVECCPRMEESYLASSCHMRKLNTVANEYSEAHVLFCPFLRKFLEGQTLGRVEDEPTGG